MDQGLSSRNFFNASDARLAPLADGGAITFAAFAAASDYSATNLHDIVPFASLLGDDSVAADRLIQFVTAGEDRASGATASDADPVIAGVGSGVVATVEALGAADSYIASLAAPEPLALGAGDDFRDTPGSTAAPLGSLAVGGSASGVIGVARDVDVFGIELAAGQSYTFNLDGASGSGGLSDPVLRLFNPSGSVVASNDDFGGGLDSQISYTATAGGTFFLEAASYGNGTGSYTLAAAGSGGNPPSGGAFDIQINYSGDARYQSVFDQAAARWESVITGDLPNVNSSQFGLIDDLLIDASVVAIDGSGGVLGQAGPDLLRSGSQLPAHGIMEFDSADVAGMAADGSLLGVILHEMGHVLGIGTLWDSLGLESNFRYTGSQALGEYRTLSGDASAAFIPVENDGGPGTAGGHWEEDVFGTELMTGFANGALPMSRMTIASLADLGYQVDLGQADAYTLPGSLRGEFMAVEAPMIGIV